MHKMMKYWLGFCALLMSVVVKAQNPMADVEMADVMRSNGKIYVVVLVLSIIFLGIVAYMISIDRKLSRLEKEQDK